MRRRAVVTGGAGGFVGSHLAERLLAHGIDVVCLDNFVTGSADNVAHLQGHDGFRLVKVDVSDYISVPGGPVDYVLHFASPASPVDYAELPIQTMKAGSLGGTLHTLGLAKEKKGARYLLASTSETYGDPLVHPQPESYWGQCQSCWAAGVLRRGEALRRGSHDVLSEKARRQYRDHADLQYIRPPACALTTVAQSRTLSTRRWRTYRSPFMATAVKRARSVMSTTWLRALCGCCSPISPGRSTSGIHTKSRCWSWPNSSANLPGPIPPVEFTARPQDDPSSASLTSRSRAPNCTGSQRSTCATG